MLQLNQTFTYSGTPLIRSLMGKKKNGRINRVLLLYRGRGQPSWLKSPNSQIRPHKQPEILRTVIVKTTWNFLLHKTLLNIGF